MTGIAKSRDFISLIRRRLMGFAEAIVVLALLGILASLFGRFHFLLDLCTHFRLQAMIAFLVCGTAILLWGRKKWGIASLALGVILVITLFPYLIPNRSIAKGAETKRLFLMNVLTSNPEKEKVIRYLREQDPDIVILLETNQAWIDVIFEELGRAYPYHLKRPRPDNFGICLMSRIPFSNAEITFWGEDFLPSVDARFKAESGREFRVIGTHPLPPIRDANWKSRNLQLAEVASAVADDASPTLVAGDFNSSPWSPWFKDFLKDSGLHDSGRGFGIWPTWVPGSLVMFALPLDHICVSEEIVVHSRKVSPALGSDHRAVTLSFSIR